MILKIMIASWNLRWQMQIRLYYRGPAWAAEARKCSAILLVRYSIWYSVYQVHHRNARINASYSIWYTIAMLVLMQVTIFWYTTAMLVTQSQIDLFSVMY